MRKPQNLTAEKSALILTGNKKTAKEIIGIIIKLKNIGLNNNDNNFITENKLLKKLK
jgi:hypothetical protein